MKPREIADLFFNESIRIENIIWIAANLDQPCDAFESLLEDLEADDLARLLEIPADRFLRLWKAGQTEEILSTLARADRTGFLVEFATPVPQSFSSDGSYTDHGFAHRHCQWVYVPVFDPIIVALFAKSWKDQYIDSMRRKHAGKTSKKRGAR